MAKLSLSLSTFTLVTFKTIMLITSNNFHVFFGSFQCLFLIWLKMENQCIVSFLNLVNIQSQCTIQITGLIRGNWDVLILQENQQFFLLSSADGYGAPCLLFFKYFPWSGSGILSVVSFSSFWFLKPKFLDKYIPRLILNFPKEHR